MKTPLELLFEELPDYTFFKVFGCACWPYLRPYNNRKLEFRCKKCVFLGYSALHKGYKCLHVPSNRVYISSSAPPTNSTPVSPGQFDDAAYSPVLLHNHGAGTGHGARLELLDVPSAAPATPTSIRAWGMQRHRAPGHLRRLLPARPAHHRPHDRPLPGRLPLAAVDNLELADKLFSEEGRDVMSTSPSNVESSILIRVLVD
jgi:hypothetical protein